MSQPEALRPAPTHLQQGHAPVEGTCTCHGEEGPHWSSVVCLAPSSPVPGTGSAAGDGGWRCYKVLYVRKSFIFLGIGSART